MNLYPTQQKVRNAQARRIMGNLRIRWNSHENCHEVYSEILGSSKGPRWIKVSPENADWYCKQFNLTMEYPQLPDIILP